MLPTPSVPLSQTTSCPYGIKCADQVSSLSKGPKRTMSKSVICNSKKHDIGSTSSSEYILPGNFCEVFEAAMPGLYLLALLLTGGQEKAETCFVAGLEDCAAGSPVFKEWARSWAKRTIIKRAIGMMSPVVASEQRNPSNHNPSETERKGAGYSSIMRLAPFERFVFVITVLERYSDQESSLLLDCTRKDVADARIRAIQQLSLLAQEEWGDDGPRVRPSNPYEIVLAQ
jgi:hypothetical protein